MNFSGGAYGHPCAQEGGESSSTDDMASSSNRNGTSKHRSEFVIARPTQRPESGDSEAKQPRIDGWKSSLWPTTYVNLTAPKDATGESSTSATASSSSISVSSREEDSTNTGSTGEESAKIEKKSLKSTDLLGFFKRKRSDGTCRA